jgi:hypothetical protein
MAGSTKADVINPAILTEAIQAQFSQKDAFFGSLAVSLGIVEVNRSFDVADPSRIGNTITVPSFGFSAEFATRTDGTEAPYQTGAQMRGDDGVIACDSLAVESSRWYRNSGVGDPYAETARNVMAAATRAMSSAVMSVAVADGIPTKDYYSSTNPVNCTPDMIDEAISMFWGDEVDDAAGGIIAHSRTISGMARLKTSDGANLIKSPDQPNMPFVVGARPAIRSDKSALIAGSTMGAVVSTGTTPPVLTLTGTPLGVFDLRIKPIATGARGTWTFQFSTDGGNTWSVTKTSAATVELIDQSDVPVATIDSLVGINGKTGLTLAIASGSAAADNTWKSVATVKATTLICAKKSLAFWYNAAALEWLEESHISADARRNAIHLYRVAVRRRRPPGLSKPGIIRIYHNVPAIT